MNTATQQQIILKGHNQRGAFNWNTKRRFR
jgi:hypothetical protein